MNPIKRFIISNTAAVIVPALITFAAGLAFAFFSYEFSGVRLNSEDIMKLAEQSFELFSAGSFIPEKNPEILLDEGYRKELEKLLSTTETDFVVRKTYEIIYTSMEISPIELEKCLVLLKGRGSAATADFKGSRYLIREYPLNFPDGDDGSLILFTRINKSEVVLNKLLLLTGITFAVSFILVSLLLSCSYYRKILSPLARLKAAAVEISEGQLDTEVLEAGEGVIRELCRSFELMRLKLKESLHNQMKLDENRKMLVSGISHDLRTPITSIKGYISGIMDGVANSPEKIEKYLKTAYIKAVQLDAMIDDLFLFSRLDMRQLPFNFQRADIVRFFEDCIAENEADMEKSGVKLQLSIGIRGCRYAVIDCERLKRVVANILDNARRYMDKPDGRIDIMLRETRENIIVEIRDNGAGISENEIQCIFDRFYRGDDARSTGGSGLGLAIARQIIEGHGGRIWARSRPGKGTGIIFSLKKAGETGGKDLQDEKDIDR